ncbi:MAG: prepilin-type N-terminal cleavage/methylation domain-containing protein [Phycisphaeraceae bacterium]|nr:prepilin-type N-terminal cleavage/methylation domain-containing protein [Phycisphaeraceae bacterium]
MVDRLLRGRPLRDPIPHPPSAIRHQAAFTLVELLIVILILGIAAGLVVPQLGHTASTRLIEAARLLAADLGEAQIESMTHGQDLRLVVFDPDNNAYQIATASDPATPITNPIGDVPYRVTFGSDRAGALTGVTIDSLSVGGDDQLGFGIYGQLDQTPDATITLACQDKTITLTVQASTGEVTINGLD